MLSLDQLESAVSQLSAEDLAKFRAWFAEFDAQRWEGQLERDIKAGKLENLAAQAIDHLHSGRCSPR